MIDCTENSNVENLWVGVIQDAWITVLKNKVGDSKRRKSYKTLLEQEKHVALSFFRDEDGMLKWVCEHSSLNYDYILELFEKSLIDDNLKNEIINNYKKMTLM